MVGGPCYLEIAAPFEKIAYGYCEVNCHLVNFHMVLPMAALSELVQTIAAVEGIDAERVGAIARAVREAGLIATHGRGPSAAQMMEKDAANLLIAVNVADTARTAPEMVSKYRTLLAGGKKQSTEFGHELEKLIFAAKNGSIPEYCMGFVRAFGKSGEPLGMRKFPRDHYRFEIQFKKPNAVVVIKLTTTAIVIFKAPDYGPGIRRRDVDRYEHVAISHRTILRVGDVLRG